MSDLEAFRVEKDAFFRDDPRSPLTPDERASFEGLVYFPENDSLRLRPKLETEGVDRDERIVMRTTTGGEQEYRSTCDVTIPEFVEPGGGRTRRDVPVAAAPAEGSCFSEPRGKGREIR